MYHPMVTFAIMQTKQEDLARDLHHHRMRAESRRTAVPTQRTGLRQRFAAYVARHPRQATTPAPSAGS